jgi:hypothetical protein
MIPSLRGEIDWSRCKSLLSLFPQKESRSVGGIESRTSYSRSTMEWREREREREREKEQPTRARRRGGVFIPPPKM